MRVVFKVKITDKLLKEIRAAEGANKTIEKIVLNEEEWAEFVRCIDGFVFVPREYPVSHCEFAGVRIEKEPEDIGPLWM